MTPQHPAFELKLIDWLIAVTIKLIDWLIAIWPNSQTHKKCFQLFFPENPQMANKETFWRMFQSLKAIALHIFLSSAWTSSTTSSALLFGPIYLMLIIIKMPRPLWHFWHVVFYSKVGTDRKWPWICVTIYFHLNLPLPSVLRCEQAVRRPLWCEINHRRSRKQMLTNDNDRWRYFHEIPHGARLVPFF